MLVCIDIPLNAKTQLYHSAIALAFNDRVTGLDPRGGRRGRYCGVGESFSCVVSRDDTNTVRRRSDRAINWRLPVHEKSHQVQVKEPTFDNLIVYLSVFILQVHDLNLLIFKMLKEASKWQKQKNSGF